MTDSLKKSIVAANKFLLKTIAAAEILAANDSATKAALRAIADDQLRLLQHDYVAGTTANIDAAEADFFLQLDTLREMRADINLPSSIDWRKYCKLMSEVGGEFWSLVSRRLAADKPSVANTSA